MNYHQVSAACGWNPIIREVFVLQKSTFVFVLYLLQAVDMLTTALLYSKYWDSLCLEITVYPTEMRGDLYVSTYYIWQITGNG